LVDKIEVRPNMAGTDQDIAERAANLIDWDIAVPKGTVKVAVSGGWVTLTGEVPWNFQRVSAEQAVRRLAGVVGIMNMVTVKARVSVPDVRRKIEQALERQADLDASAVTITVDGDKVRLDGRVRAWFERELVEKAAWGAQGVCEVEDHLRIAG
jgi:osmotically-inducible protein OsmY